MSETAVSIDLLRKLVASAYSDKDVAVCEQCGGPLWPEDEQSSVSDIRGCWFAATGREKDRPEWCLERQMLASVMQAMEDEAYARFREAQP